MTYSDIEKKLVYDGYVAITTTGKITEDSLVLSVSEIDGLINESIMWHCGNIDNIINNTHITILNNKKKIQGIYKPTPDEEEKNYIEIISGEYIKELGG